MTMKKKPQDLTIRNLRAIKKRITKLEKEIKNMAKKKKGGKKGC